MTKKERSALFTVLTSVLNIVITLSIEAVLIVGLFFIIRMIPNAQDNIPVTVVLPFILFAGLIAGLLSFVKVTGWIIKTFKLEDKLDAKIVKRYIHQ